MTIPESLQALAGSLGRLAAPAANQIAYLTALGVADLVDELALEFDDLYRPRVGQLQQASAQSSVACRDLDRMLSNDQLGWTFADLESREWERIRATAARALDALVLDSAGDSP